MIIFISVLTYALGKALGIPGAARAFTRQLDDPPTLAADDVLPCARTIHRFRDMADLIIFHGAGTSLPKARSRAAHAALESKADLWVMIDDDVETDLKTARALVTLSEGGRAAILPCAVRGSDAESHIINCVWDSPLVSLVNGIQARRVLRGGCGCMVVPRAALEKVTEAYRSTLTFLDDDRASKVALFQQVLVGAPEQLWFGEDFSFCERLRAAGVEIVAPVVGLSSHDGAVVDLAECSRL